MKLLVTVLALGVFAGSQVFVLGHKPDSALGWFQAFLRNLTTDLEVKRNIVQSSEFGAGLLGLLHGAHIQASRRLRKLEDELPAEVTEGIDAVVGVSAGVVEKGIRILYESWRKEDSEKQLNWALTDLYANASQGGVASYAGPFLDYLIARTQEANENLNENLKYHLESLRPHAQDVQSQVYLFQESVVQPIVDRTTETFKMVVEEVNQVAKPYLAPLLSAVREHKAEFKDWVSDPVFSPEQ